MCQPSNSLDAAPLAAEGHEHPEGCLPASLRGRVPVNSEYSPSNSVFNGEPAPNPESGMLPARETDRHGVPRLRIDDEPRARLVHAFDDAARDWTRG
jgi:hypothetical protein